MPKLIKIKPTKPLKLTSGLLEQCKKTGKNRTYVAYERFRQPTATGIYAVRIPMQGTDVWCEDAFMYWDNDRKRWGYTGSTENYRGVVVGWLGPLQRLLQADDIPF